MKQPFRLADYYQLRAVSQPAVAPDGKRVAFVLQGFRRKDNDRYQNLWLAPTDGSAQPHRLTRGNTSDSGPAWSPDGRYLAFLSTRPHELEVAVLAAAEAESQKPKTGAAAAQEQGQGQGQEQGQGQGEAPSGKDDKPKPQIWVLDLGAGGEPRQLTWREEGVSEFDWAPDGRRLVFASRDPSPEQKKYLESVRGGEQGKDRGPIVIDRVQHKHDQHGYLDEVRTHLFLVDVETRAVRRLTGGPCDERQARWSPDGRWVAFVSNRTGDPDNNQRYDLWLVEPDAAVGAEGAVPARRLTFGDLAVSGPRWSPDSRYLAFSSPKDHPENGYVLRHLLAVAVDGGEPVADLAACVGEGWTTIGGIVPDHGGAADPAANARVYPVPLRRTPVIVLTAGLDRPVFWDGPVWITPREVLALAGDRGQTRLVRARLGDGGAASAELVFPVDDRLCTLWDAAAAGGVAVVALDRPEAGTNLFAVPIAELGRPGAETRATRLTRFNDEILANRATARHRRIEFPNRDGDTVEALVLLPPGFDPANGPAPLLVSIHGGPMWYDSPSFRFDEQYWAGLGYVVLLVNYRGSISYGEDFCRVIQGDWGPREHDDVMSGVQAVIDRGWADPSRLYCTGFSQGGIMTNWAVGHTDLFRAAVSEHGMWDYVSAFGTDDCHLWWQDDLGVPWQNEAGYRRISPASGASRIRTPLLITAGEVDWRCPLTQAEQLYLTLKKRGVPTRLVIYQGERHAIGRPRRALDRIIRICRWLAEYGGPPFGDDSAEGYPSQ